MNQHRRLFWRAVLPLVGFLTGAFFMKCTEDRRP